MFPHSRGLLFSKSLERNGGNTQNVYMRRVFPVFPSTLSGPKTQGRSEPITELVCCRCHFSDVLSVCSRDTGFDRFTLVYLFGLLLQTFTKAGFVQSWPDDCRLLSSSSGVSWTSSLSQNFGLGTPRLFSPDSCAHASGQASKPGIVSSAG